MLRRIITSAGHRANIKSMLNTILQYRAKTRKAYLMATRVEEQIDAIKFYLKDEENELQSLKSQVEKQIKKGKPTANQKEALALIEEVETLRNGNLKKYITPAKGKNATKKKK